MFDSDRILVCYWISVSVLVDSDEWWVWFGACDGRLDVGGGGRNSSCHDPAALRSHLSSTVTKHTTFLSAAWPNYKTNPNSAVLKCSVHLPVLKYCTSTNFNMYALLKYFHFERLSSFLYCSSEGNVVLGTLPRIYLTPAITLQK